MLALLWVATNNYREFLGEHYRWTVAGAREPMARARTWLEARALVRLPARGPRTPGTRHHMVAVAIEDRHPWQCPLVALAGHTPTFGNGGFHRHVQVFEARPYIVGDTSPANISVCG